MKKIFVIFGVFAIVSSSVLAEDFMQTELYKCIKKESLVIRKVVLKECGISENLAVEYDLAGKITDAQQKCLQDNLKKNQEKYQSKIDEITAKCKNFK